MLGGQTAHSIVVVICVCLVAVAPSAATYGTVPTASDDMSQTGDASVDRRAVPGTSPPGAGVADVPGDPSQITVPRNASDPDGDGTFEDVNGDGEVNVVDVQALLAGRDTAAVTPGKFDFNSDGRITTREPELLFWLVTDGPLGNDTDGDGLPNAYERRVVGTDPASADTDGDGVADPRTDHDGDDLETGTERRLGTTPTAADTDGDGLPDRVELSATGLSPTASDTNGDGVSDERTDLDGDGADALTEVEAGTSPSIADTDGDGLDDGAELGRLATSPTDADTDDDGLDDGVENDRLPTTPTDPDSDGDDTADGNESFRTSATDPETGVAVTFAGSGGTVGAETEIRRANGRVANATYVQRLVVPGSEVVDIRPPLGASFDEAQVSLQYADSVTNESELALFRYNSTLNRFEKLDSTVNSGNNTVTARTTDFSRFAVFRVPNWEAQYEAVSQSTANPEATSVDVVFVVDTSGSMAFNDPSGLRKTAAKRFVGGLIQGDRVAVVGFDDSASVKQGLTSDLGAANASITNELGAGGGTDIGDGLRKARSQLGSNDRGKLVVLLTDGRDTSGEPGEPLAEARQFSDDVTINTVGFGNADRSLLRQIAGETGGEFTGVDDASDLPEVFDRLSNRTTESDSDGDGLPDRLERNGVLVPGTAPYLSKQQDGVTAVEAKGTSFSVMYRVTTDPNATDTDGDGRSDTAEFGDRNDFLSELIGKPVYNYASNPQVANTDGGYLNDSEEILRGSDPARLESINAGFGAVTVVDGNRPATVSDLGTCCGAITEGSTQIKGGDLVIVPTALDSRPGNRYRATVKLKVFFDANRAAIDALSTPGRSPYRSGPAPTATVDVNPHVNQLKVVSVSSQDAVSADALVGELTLTPGQNETLTYAFTVEDLSGSTESGIAGGLSNTAADPQQLFDVQMTVRNFNSAPFSREGADTDTRTLERSYSVAASADLQSVGDVVRKAGRIYGQGIAVASLATGAASAYAARGAGAAAREVGVFLGQQTFTRVTGLPIAPTGSPSGLAAAGTAQAIILYGTYLELYGRTETQIDAQSTLVTHTLTRQN